MRDVEKTLVILTLNEIEGVREIYPRLPLDKVDEVLVIDGGSEDGTVEFFREKGIPVFIQDVRGRGEAFRLASRVSKGRFLLFFSPDGNEDPNDIPGLFKLLEDGFDLAVASRFLPGARNDEEGKLFPARAWANRIFTVLADIFFKGKMTDTINGYRAIRKDKFMLLHLDASGFAIEYQMSIRAMKSGMRIAEIPTIEGDRIGGKSTAYSIPTGIKVLKVLLREIAIGTKFLKCQAK